MTASTPSSTRALRRGGDFGFGLDREPGEDGELGFVRHEEARLAARSMSRSRTAGAGLSTVLTPCVLAEGERRVDGLERHLELGQDEIAGLESVAGALDVLRARSPLAPLTMRMQLSPDLLSTRMVAVPVDWPAMRRTCRVSTPEALEILSDAVAKRIVAKVRHHDDFGPKLRRRDRLVGALAAETHLEARRGDRLAPDRHAVDVVTRSTLLEPTTPIRGRLRIIVPPLEALDERPLGLRFSSQAGERVCIALPGCGPRLEDGVQPR